MNLFCRLLGHTWVDKAETPKIVWTTAKNLSELDMTVHGEPRFWLECARCHEQRAVDAPERRGAARAERRGAS